MHLIRPLGRYFSVDKAGFLINDCHSDLIQSPWDQAIQAGRDFIMNRCSDQVLSLYLRGSIARGLAVVQLSDVDFFAILKSGNKRWSNPEWDWGPLKQQFPFVYSWECPHTSWHPNLFKEYEALGGIGQDSGCFNSWP